MFLVVFVAMLFDILSFMIYDLNRLRKGINILISTPGRLVDHIKSTKNLHFNRIRWLIVDEADR
jgi:superfamily II DNA/RNA helicase